MGRILPSSDISEGHISLESTNPNFLSRRERSLAPRLPQGEIQLRLPPERENIIPPTWYMQIMPWLMLTGTFGMLGINMLKNGPYVLLHQPMLFMVPFIMMLSGVFSMFLNNRGGREQARLNEARKEYLLYLAKLRAQVREIAQQQSKHLWWNYPDVNSLFSLIGGPRMWERKAGHADFGRVRLGLGKQNLAIQLLTPPIEQEDKLDPVAYTSLQQFLVLHRYVYDFPMTMGLTEFSAVFFAAVGPEALTLVRNILLQVALFHGPDLLLISFITNNPEAKQWNWAKWLAHANHPYIVDSVGNRRLFFASVLEWEECFSEDLQAREIFSHESGLENNYIFHIVILCDDFSGQKFGHILTPAGLAGVVVFDMCGVISNDSDTIGQSPWKNGLELIVKEGEILVHSHKMHELYSVSFRKLPGITSDEPLTQYPKESYARIDESTMEGAEIFARALASWKVPITSSRLQYNAEIPHKHRVDLLELLDISDPKHITPHSCWQPRQGRERLCVPFGLDVNGMPVELDIKEGAEMGYGPHGLCIGATGSGKSEFLRTLILSMIVTHSPEELNFVLVDFKGGATFLGFEKLSHVSAVITNLEAESHLVQRMADALEGEINRRQNILRSAGNYANVGEYNRDCTQNKMAGYLPALFIIVDEFTELLTRFPEFGALFDMIGRLGRSLYIHMLLASQRLQGANTDKIIANLSYRIVLKTFNSTDSHQAIGSVAGYSLPSQPGCGYLYCHSAHYGEQLIRFETFYTSGPYISGKITENPSHYSQLQPSVQRFTAGIQSSQVEDLLFEANTSINLSDNSLSSPSKLTIADTIIEALAYAGKPAHPIWLAPLENPPALSNLYSSIKNQSQNFPNFSPVLSFPIGLIDKPYYQRQDILMANGNGHIGCVGAPQSGKSQALSMIILSAALANSPRQVQFYCLDFGGGTLYSLENLPHIGAIFGQHDTEGVQRVLTELLNILQRRERIFKSHRISAFDAYRRIKTEHNITGIETILETDVHGDIYLVLDGYAVFKQKYESLLPQLETIVEQGLSYGIHVIIAATRWLELRPNIREKLLFRYELYLGNSLDSELDSRAARRIPPGRPGRGIYVESLQDGTQKSFDILIGVPRLDNRNSMEVHNLALEEAILHIQKIYPDDFSPPIRILPVEISRETILAQLFSDERILTPAEAVIGIDEDLSPVILNFDISPLFLGFASPGSGKTTLIRNIIYSLQSEISSRLHNRQNKIILCDYRRTLLTDPNIAQLHSYVSSEVQLISAMADLVHTLQERIPPPALSREQLHNKYWWEGPHYYVIIDDYDLVSQGNQRNIGSKNPLDVLAPFVPIAQDIGLRIIIMRRSGGAFRASMEPLLKTMREMNTDGIMMNGDPNEDALLGKNIKMTNLLPGRGVLVSHHLGVKMIHLAKIMLLNNR